MPMVFRPHMPRLPTRLRVLVSGLHFADQYANRFLPMNFSSRISAHESQMSKIARRYEIIDLCVGNK